MSLLLAAAAIAASVAVGDTDGAIAPLPTELMLVNPHPRDPARTALTVTRHSGLVWHSSTPIGTRTPMDPRSLSFPGPAFYGAPPQMADDLVLVRTREPLPIIAVSPYTRFNEVDVSLLKRRMPWIRRTPTIERDVVRAQQLWLEQAGLIQAVRTHINPRHFTTPHPGAEGEVATPPVSEIRPRGVIRVHPVDEGPKRQADASSAPETIRVSAPAPAKAPIRVLHAEAPQNAQAEADETEA